METSPTPCCSKCRERILGAATVRNQKAMEAGPHDCIDSVCECHTPPSSWSEDLRKAWGTPLTPIDQELREVVIAYVSQNFLHKETLRKEVEKLIKEAQAHTDVNNAVEAINVSGFRSKERSQEVLYLGHYQALDQILKLID